MPTYVYETLPPRGTEPERFEWRQAMSEPPLEKHPATGVPVRRVISGGLGFLPVSGTPPEPGPACGPESCRCGRFDA